VEIDASLMRRLGVCPDAADSNRLLVSESTSIWAALAGQALMSDQGPGGEDKAVVVTRVVSADEFEAALGQRPQTSAADVIDQTQLEGGLERILSIDSTNNGSQADPDAPVIRMVNAILNEAVQRKASDIHLEPYESASRVRLRIDGVLVDLAQPPKNVFAALISRIKIMASLDIAERRLPQDGRLTVRLPKQSVDCRVSTLPTAYGERAVLRLLQKQQGQTPLTSLGMGHAMLRDFEQLLDRPHGILLVTGPTGSGKTTTLYASLQRLQTQRENIMTVEDPIEVEMKGVSQTAVSPKIGLTFASALRAILRQDPDILMIGEIRDKETAQIAVQAALTGHLVLATLHTNDSSSAMTRLIDMGVEPFLLASTVNGVLAQRLIRRLCPECKVAASRPGLFEAQQGGCIKCNHTGYAGRTGIYELMPVTEPIAALIKDGLDAPRLRQAALAQGLVELKADAQRWLAQGETSEQEVARVLSSIEVT